MAGHLLMLALRGGPTSDGVWTEPSNVNRHEGRNAGDACEACRRLDLEQSDSQLWRHQPYQTPGKTFLQRLAIEVLFLRGMQRYDPARMVDVPGARAASVRDLAEQRVLKGAAF